MSALHLFDVAELAKEAGIAIEDGPGRHGIGGATFLYMLEPAGNRIEVMGDPGYMIFDPAWKTGLEGFGARCRRCLDRLADAGLFLELRDAFSSRVAGDFPKSRC
jgi:hypothetical protein